MAKTVLLDEERIETSCIALTIVEMLMDNPILFGLLDKQVKDLVKEKNKIRQLKIELAGVLND